MRSGSSPCWATWPSGWRPAASAGDPLLIPAEIIIRKRDGGSLGDHEWAAFFDGYRQGAVADYQVAALLMAIYFQGLSPAETHGLTRIMIDSGERWTWPEGPPVGDKHSTGGVGDKVSLVLAPLAAAAGLRVPMVSGRGLGHTGGTLDKLESMPGFRTELQKADYDRLLDEVGYAMGGQTAAFAPLDRDLYALRDVTGTVESVPLITASIMSKKIAEGLDALILDVKWGDGAFMRSREEAERLARSLIETGAAFGLPTEALVTDMNAPLGRTVGHALEVREAIELLRGEPADPRLHEVVTRLTERLLVLTGAAADDAEAVGRVTDAFASGAALDRFRRDVVAQGGDPAVVDAPEGLPRAPVRRPLLAPRAAFVAALPARGIGETLIGLGGGRRLKGDAIDPAVGIELPAGVGARREEGEPWALVHARTDADADVAAAALESLIEWSEEPVEPPPVVAARVEA